MIDLIPFSEDITGIKLELLVASLCSVSDDSIITNNFIYPESPTYIYMAFCLYNSMPRITDNRKIHRIITDLNIGYSIVTMDKVKLKLITDYPKSIRGLSKELIVQAVDYKQLSNSHE